MLQSTGCYIDSMLLRGEFPEQGVSSIVEGSLADRYRQAIAQSPQKKGKNAETSNLEAEIKG